MQTVQEGLHTDGMPEVQSTVVFHKGQKLLPGVSHKEVTFTPALSIEDMRVLLLYIGF